MMNLQKNALVAGLIGIGAISAAETVRPNILFIAADDMKPVMGAYGDPLARTPNLDVLAARSTLFLNAHCQWSVCGPSRASLMTGLMPETTGVMSFKAMRGKLPGVVTLPQYFRANGYETAGTGKLNDPRCVEGGRNSDDPLSWSVPYRRGYNSNAWKPEGKPPFAAPKITDSEMEDFQICNSGINLLEELAAGGKPFFLGVGFRKPHLPFTAPKKYWELYDRNEIPIAAYQDLPRNGYGCTWHHAAELRQYDGIPKEGPLEKSLQQELIHGYYACVSMIDAQVGRLIKRLDELGLTENTIIVFWGDHGFHLGDHGDWAKHTNMEQATRVPLLIAVPESMRGSSFPMFGRVSHPAGFIDLYPTLCELAGLDVLKQLQGRSLVPTLKNPDSRVRNGIITVFRLFKEKSIGYAYRTDRYRYVEWFKDDRVWMRELYDYETDPLETVNLAAEKQYGPLMEELAVQMRADGIGCDTLLEGGQ